MKTVGHPVPELHQRDRTGLDVAGVEDRKVASVLTGAPYRGEQPAIAFGGIPGPFDEDGLRNGVCLLYTSPSPRD